MTTEEFIESFNDKGTSYAEVDEQGTVYIYDAFDSMMASLEKENGAWKIEVNSYFSPSSMRLMAELADTPPDKRVKPPRYVILNGEPIEGWLGHSTTCEKYFAWHFFTIGHSGPYLVSQNTTDPEVLTQYSYTREELERQKQWLPEEWRSIIDNLLTPLDVALEGKGNDHMEQD